MLFRQKIIGWVRSVEFDIETREESLQLIDLALAEDLGSSHRSTQLDCTTESVVTGDVDGQARFVARQPGVICGLVVCRLVVNRIDRPLSLENLVADGQSVSAGEPIAVLTGRARDILVTERTCLNFLGRLSGISTLTRQFVDRVRGTNAKLYDTRKTTPAWRRLEKYAVRCGGGENHRMGLFDAVLIKDNHLAMLARLQDCSSSAVEQAIQSARRWIDANAHRLPHGKQTKLQIEVDRHDQLRRALAEHPDMILLDNMDIDELRESVRLRDETAPQVLLEASGGVSLETVGKIAQTGVDRISVGALTHSAVNLDIGLDWELS